MAVRSLEKQRHSSSSEVGGLVVASKRRRPADVGRRLVEAPRQVRLLNIFSVVRAAKLHMRQWRSSQLNWWELLLLLMKRGSLLDGWELLLLLPYLRRN